MVDGFSLGTPFLLFPLTDRPLRYCDVPPGGTCCTHTIENKLAVHAKTLLERNTKDSISKLSSVLGIRAQKFNGKSLGIFTCVSFLCLYIMLNNAEMERTVRPITILHG